MSTNPVLGPPAPRGLLGVLKSWLQAEPIETWETSAGLPVEAAARKPHNYGSVRVLVVDDNPVNVMMMTAQMASRGLVPWVAADGAEAVALACELPFDLIFMDLQMPVLDGYGATAAIRRFEGSRSRPAVPVVAYSSNNPGPRVLAAHGLNGSLDKPCGDRELEDCLVRWCPTYHSAPAVSGAARDYGSQQFPSRSAGPHSATLR